MARKIKIPNERLKRFAREEQKRKKNIRNKRKYYLIVCEGEATEPNYFEGLKQDLPKGVLTPVLGEGFRYEKNSEQMYAWLKEHGSQEDAIRNGKRLAEQFDGRQDYARHNPCTMVGVLVEELLKLKLK
jgi:hypothetical protein